MDPLERPDRKFQNQRTMAKLRRPSWNKSRKLGAGGGAQKELWNQTDLGPSLSPTECWPGDHGQVKSTQSQCVHLSNGHLTELVWWVVYWNRVC